jgi:hypothetical protein
VLRFRDLGFYRVKVLQGLGFYRSHDPLPFITLSLNETVQDGTTVTA